jgi:hypothetical protein
LLLKEKRINSIRTKTESTSIEIGVIKEITKREVKSNKKVKVIFKKASLRVDRVDSRKARSMKRAVDSKLKIGEKDGKRMILELSEE